MKKIILLLLSFITIELSGQCVIDGTTYGGAPIKAKAFKGCDVIVQSLSNGIVKSSGDSLKTAIPDVDYSTPSGISDSLDNYLKLSGGTMSGSIDLNNNNLIDVDSLNCNNIVITGTVDNGSPDAAFAVRRTLDITAQNGHGIADQTIFNRSTRAYAAFDAAVGMSGSGGFSYDHFIGFQARGNYNSAGTLSTMYGFGDFNSSNAGNTSLSYSFVSQINNDGQIGNRYAMAVYDYTGGGTVAGDQIGYYCANITKGSGNKYAFYADGSTKSYFGGTITGGTLGSAMLKSVSGVITPAVAGTDYQAALTNPVTGTASTNQVAVWSSSSEIGGSSSFTASAGAVTAVSFVLSANSAIGSAAVTGQNLTVSKNITGAVTSYGIRSTGTVQSDVTTAVIGFNSELNTQATSFTLTDYRHFFVTQGTIGAGSAVTNQYGYQVSSGLTGATTNYGFYSNLGASGTARWNMYMAGTAHNYMAGMLGIKTTALTAPTAYLHLGAGTTAASTAPEKYTTGSLNSVAEAGAVEYNNAFYQTKNSGLRYALGGTIFDAFADAGNSTTTETDLHTYTTPANTLESNGGKIFANYAGTFVSSATATRQMKVYFGGTTIFDSGTLTISAAAAWDVKVTIIRVSSTVIRYTVAMNTQNAALAAYTAVGELTGLTLSNTNIIKITGQAAGVGAATNDIVLKLAAGEWKPVANN